MTSRTEPRTKELRTRETRARRAASRQGLVLEKSHRKDRRALDYGRYRLSPIGQAPTDRTGPTFTLTLDAVEAHLSADPSEDTEADQAA